MTEETYNKIINDIENMSEEEYLNLLKQSKEMDKDRFLQIVCARSRDWWCSYCDTCKHKGKLPPYCDRCRNHELVPYSWDYDDTRECFNGGGKYCMNNETRGFKLGN